MVKDLLRVVRFNPYRPGCGPVFRLITWDANRKDYGKWVIGYRFSFQREPGSKWKVLFEGEDFGCSHLHAIDSNAAVAGIMGFLTLRPGDTDKEYFATYSRAQLAYCSAHAEALACAVEIRFGDH